MVLFPACIVLALVVGLARGGSLKKLNDFDLRLLVVLVAAVLVRVAAGLATPPGSVARTGAGTLSFVLVFVWLVANVPPRPRSYRCAMTAVLLGAGLNAAVIAANGGMPVSVAAARTSGIAERDMDDALSGRQRTSDRTTLRPLADVIPLPGLGDVISIGDIVLAIGIFRIAQLALLHGDPRGEESSRRRTPDEGSESSSRGA